MQSSSGTQPTVRGRSSELGEAPPQNIARSPGGESGHDGKGEIRGRPARLTRVDVEDDLDREGRERGEAAEEADSQTLADLAGEPAARGEHAQDERAGDVDRGRRPEQRLVM